MNTSSVVALKMDHIQNLFLKVQEYMQGIPEMDELIRFLDSEQLEFRSVAYESASMEIGAKELTVGGHLRKWNQFFRRSSQVHSFHIDIGIGWALAKVGIFPEKNWESLNSLRRWMVFDGIGYYYGLFKGRKTVRNHQIPNLIQKLDMGGFDQGLGRRLWYISQGEVDRLSALIQAFPSTRQQDLWRGVGVACGYVGGTDKKNLQRLLGLSGEYRRKLSSGIALAAMSRIASNSMTKDLEVACHDICGISLDEMNTLYTNMSVAESIVHRKEENHWMDLLDSNLAQFSK